MERSTLSRPANRRDEKRSPSILGLTGLGIDGGIASVSRSIVRAFDDRLEADAIGPVHRVLLLDHPAGLDAPPARCRQHAVGGAQGRFVARLWSEILRRWPRLVLFDHVGLARALLPRLPIPRPGVAIFVHGLELRGAERGARRAALLNANWILANSDYTRDRLAQQIPEIAERIRTVPLCIEPARIEEWEQGGTSESTGPRRPAALIVGRMWKDQPGKGHDALIRAWPAVRAAVPEAELWVAGTGDDQDRLRTLACDCGVDEAVRFMGRVSNQKLSELYSQASLFAMPSSQEGFGLVYLEAMWHGLPCLASTADAGSVVVDEGCGALVPYGDAEATAREIGALLANPARARALGDAARVRARTHFSFDSFSARLGSVLELG